LIAELAQIVLWASFVTPSICPYCQSSRLQLCGFSRAVQSASAKRRQRFFCSSCLRKSCDHSLSLCFRLKKLDLALNGKIFTLFIEGISQRRISRSLSISEHCVQIRLRRLAVQALHFQSNILQPFRIHEALCFDGLENFAASQYDVNNLQQALGRDSLFIYDFNLATLNRKGHMSPWQINRLSDIESLNGRYNPRSIRHATVDILSRLYQKRSALYPFTLISDEHFQYRRAINIDLSQLKIDHVTISSKISRNFQNILFSVNHADLLIRQRVAAFARETISFSKTHASMCQKYALFMIYKNFMLPQFSKKHVRRPMAHQQSPAQMIGITNRVLNFSDIFQRKCFVKNLADENPDWANFANGKIAEKYHRSHHFVRTA
jgi:transposase-like protein